MEGNMFELERKKVVRLLSVSAVRPSVHRYSLRSKLLGAEQKWSIRVLGICAEAEQLLDMFSCFLTVHEKV